jgi:hypothetical protein
MAHDILDLESGFIKNLICQNLSSNMLNLAKPKTFYLLVES